MIGNPVTRGAEASGASELVAAFLEAAEAALASVGDPHTLHEEITRGERADHGGVDAFGGRWEWFLHGFDIGYRSPSGVEVDLSFMGGDGWAVFDWGTIGSFATFNGHRWVVIVLTMSFGCAKNTSPRDPWTSSTADRANA